MGETRTHKTYTVFIASSMLNPCREAVENIVERVNTKLDLFDVNFKLVAYSMTPMADRQSKTQELLNHQAATSDILILLADNNTTIGQYTFGEYKAAHCQSTKSPDKRPAIKVFVITEKKDDRINLEYTAEDGSTGNFEAVLHEDSKRYTQCLTRDRFYGFLEDWLIKTAVHGLKPIQTQYELSYSDHLYRIGQGGIRESGNKYYRRDKLDGQIEEILKVSPIIILEGNTYSGKTRAAFEYMKNCKEWEDYDFHIFDNRHFIKDLNQIRNLDYSGSDRGDVFFFDDVNDILNKKNDEDIERTHPLWSKINGYNALKGFSIDDFGKTRIIFTVSGKLSALQRNKIYERIFNEGSDRLSQALEKITVNFDIYDQFSFKQMANAMVRDGVLNRANIRPGNYTIGSLFIRTEDILKKVTDQYRLNKALIPALACHFKYAARSRFTGLKSEIQEVYDFICNALGYGQKEPLEDGIERLRQEGLVVTEDQKENLYRVFIDKYILDSINEVALKYITYRNTEGVNAINRILIDYALECEKDGKRNMTSHHICYVTQMAYLIIDRNTIGDQETVDLIDIVASALMPQNQYNPKKSENVRLILKLADIASSDENYPMIFATSALSNIEDPDKVNDLLDKCLAYYGSCLKIPKEETARTVIELYKRSAYAKLSKGMPMAEEQKILRRILESDGNWKIPFGDEDLKEIFNLARLAPHIKSKTPREIIALLPHTGIDGRSFSPDSCEDTDGTDDSFDDFEETGTSGEVSTDADNMKYEKIYLKQLNKAAIAAMLHIDSFSGFADTIDCLRKTCEESNSLKTAAERYFAYDFYRIVREIVKRINYEDRSSIFNFILEIDDTKGVLGNLTIQKEYLQQLRSSRIHSLNDLLQHLDENDALKAYQDMIGKDLCDSHTLSCLLNNRFLNFEQILRLVGKDDGQYNFITLNQLLGKAETISDANICLRLMGISNCDPCKIRDENALANYLKIKYIDSNRCINIIKGRRRLFPDTLSDAMLGIILKKFDIRQLMDIFFQSEENSHPGYYANKYGLTDEEIEKVRKNAIILNMLFYKANLCSEEIADLVKGKFEELISDEKMRPLVTDPESNGNNGILSVYMKNKHLFRNYESVRNFYDNLPDECKPGKVDHNIYGVFAWYIIDGYNNGIYDRTEAIRLLNGELIKAYGEFARLYRKDDVIGMMARLYHYRPLLEDEDSFSQTEEYAYEDRIYEMDYRGYLEYLIKYNPAYADSTFIYNSLAVMQKRLVNEVYETLADLASLNHTGVIYDTVFKENAGGKSLQLAGHVQQRLFRIGPGTLEIDNRLVYNVSYIKMLWFLLSKGLMTLDEAEKCRKENNIPVTETYLNLVCKCIEQDTASKRLSPKNNSTVMEDGYSRMLGYMQTVFSSGTIYVHRSIQMCLSLIAVAPDEASLEDIFSKHGFSEFENKTEVIGATMNKLLNLRYKSAKADETVSEFKEMIVRNCRNVNIWIINAYLNTFVKISKNELKSRSNAPEAAPFERCWQLLRDECKIDVFRLLNLDQEQEAFVTEQLGLSGNKWILDANVQTFSYFALHSPDVLAIMQKWFKGNFTYDDAGRKSCLKDTLKNYAFSYARNNFDKESAQKTLDPVRKIIRVKENYKVFKEICSRYVTDQSRKWGGKNEMSVFWEDILSNLPQCAEMCSNANRKRNRK